MAVTAERVSVGDTATALNAAESDNVSGSSLVLFHNGSTNVDVGGSGVTSGGGFQLAPGDTLSAEIPGGEQLFAISASTETNEIHVLRSGV